jgi:hypothetical protein
LLIFLPFFLLFLTLIALIAALRFRPESRIYWFISAGGSIAAWLSLLYFRFRLPLNFSIPYWNLDAQLDLSIQWQLDPFSWTLIFALVSLFLANQLAEVLNFSDRSVWSWMPAFAIVIISSMSALANNLLTLVLVLFLLDAFILAIHIRKSKKIDEFRQHVLAFFSTSLSTIILIWLFATQVPFQLSSIPESAVLVMLIASGIRLGLLPLNLALYPNSDESLAENLLYKIAALLPGFVLLTRISTPLIEYSNFLLFLALGAALFAGVKWIFSDKVQGFESHFLILCASLAFASGILGEALNVQMWALIAILLAGASQFLKFAFPFKRLIIIISLIMLIGLPFTPTAQSFRMYSTPSTLLVFAFLLPQSMAIAGALRKINLLRAQPDSEEKWQRSIYALAFLLLPSIFFLLGLGLNPSVPSTELSNFSLISILAMLLVGILFFANFKSISLSSELMERFDFLFSFNWFYKVIEKLLLFISTIINIFSSLLEGSAGILWALLLIALLLSIIRQLSATI